MRLSIRLSSRSQLCRPLPFSLPYSSSQLSGLLLGLLFINKHWSCFWLTNTVVILLYRDQLRYILYYTCKMLWHMMLVYHNYCVNSVTYIYILINALLIESVIGWFNCSFVPLISEITVVIYFFKGGFHSCICNRLARFLPYARSPRYLAGSALVALVGSSVWVCARSCKGDLWAHLSPKYLYIE